MPKAKIVDGAVSKTKEKEKRARKPGGPSSRARRGAAVQEEATSKARAAEAPMAARRKSGPQGAVTASLDASKPTRKPRGAAAGAAKRRAAKATPVTSQAKKKPTSRKAGSVKTESRSPVSTTTRRSPSRAAARDSEAPEAVAVAVLPKVATFPPPVAVKPASPEVPAKASGESIPPFIRGESRLLLLVRDPGTLFATWEVDPSTAAALKARIGSRALAVSTFTIRLTSAGGGTRVVHVSRRARSRYLKADGAPSYVAEIGLTTPTGHFEFVARSAPCFVPAIPLGRRPGGGTLPAVLGYREARALARRGLLFSSLRQTMKKQSRPALGKSRRASGGQPTPALTGGAPSAPATAVSASPLDSSRRPTSLTSRVLGGASDLYRR